MATPYRIIGESTGCEAASGSKYPIKPATWTESGKCINALRKLRMNIVSNSIDILNVEIGKGNPQ
jgi:hypothetical protein